MGLRPGDTAPDFTVETTGGAVRFHAWLGSSWEVLFSHPEDDSPVCTTELGRAADARSVATGGRAPREGPRRG